MSKRPRSAYRKGKITKGITRDHYIQCDNTGLQVLSSDAKTQWDGLLVWKGQFEERHPQEFVRGVRDDFAVRNARPEAPDTIVLGTAIIAENTDTQSVFNLAAIGSLGGAYVSFVRFLLTSADLSAQTLWLEWSFDGVSFVRGTDPVFSTVVQSWISGADVMAPLGRNVESVRLVADYGSPVTRTWEIELTALGGTA
jgi:hypothetical protein